MRPKYSFILPAYKAKYLREADDSILAQKYKDFELVIVNDASPENLNEILRDYEDPRIRYFTNDKNIGGLDLVAQWNKCLDYSKGDYVILATDDDVYHPEFLLKIDSLVCKYPEVYAFRPRVQYFGENVNSQDIEVYMPEKSSRNTFLYFFLRRLLHTGIGFWVYQREYLMTCGGYQSLPSAWFADDMTAMKLCVNGVCMTNDVLFKFRVHHQSISGSKNDVILLRNKILANLKFRKFCEEYFLSENNVGGEEGISSITLFKIANTLCKRILNWDITQSDKFAIIKNYGLIKEANALSHLRTFKLIFGYLI